MGGEPLRTDGPDRRPGATIEGLDISKADVEIGVLIFDVEHREMLAGLGDLYEAIADGQSKPHMRQALAKLLEVSKRHFEHEEDYMRDLNYDQYIPHKEDHDLLGLKLEGAVAALFSDGGSAAGNLASIPLFFKQWLLDHILEHDRSLAAFLAHKGIR